MSVRASRFKQGWCSMVSSKGLKLQGNSKRARSIVRVGKRFICPPDLVAIEMNSFSRDLGLNPVGTVKHCAHPTVVKPTVFVGKK